MPLIPRAIIVKCIIYIWEQVYSKYEKLVFSKLFPDFTGSSPREAAMQGVKRRRGLIFFVSCLFSLFCMWPQTQGIYMRGLPKISGIGLPFCQNY